MTIPIPPMPSVTTPGRGDWTKTGGTTPYYALVTSGPRVGSEPTKDFAHWAVMMGARGLQARVNALGYTPALVVDGDLGPKSDAGIKWVQAKLGTTADGLAGPATMRRLFAPIALTFELSHGIPRHLLCGLLEAESSWDPGAQGYNTPWDMGIGQENLKAVSATAEQAFDPTYAIPYAGGRMAGAHAALYDRCTKSGADPWKVAVAQYNSPLWAGQWADSGQPPNDTIAKYVQRAVDFAATY